MKKYSKIIIILLFVVSILNACTKEDGVFKEGGSNGVIQLNLPSNESAALLYPLQSKAFEISPSIEYPLTVEYLGTVGAPSDITVNIKIDPAALTAYNTKQGTNFVSLPSTVYTYPTSVVIPAGQKSATVMIKLNTTLVTDFNTKYAIPLGISSVSQGTVSKNYGFGIYAVSIKNKYDGIYKVTNLVFNNVTAPAHTANTPRTRHLVTRSATESMLYDPGISGVFYGVSFLNAGSGSYYGNFSPVFTFNTTTDVVTSVANYYPVPNSSNRDAKLDPTGVNKMTIVSASNKTLEVSYIMTVGGVNTLYLKEKWEYTGSRP